MKDLDLSIILDVADIKINSFIDTGNIVRDIYTGYYVIFLKNNLEKVILDNLKNNYEITDICISTVNGISNEKGYIVHNIKLIKQNKEVAIIPNVILCFMLNSNTPEKYSAIIGYDLYLENINGGV